MIRIPALAACAVLLDGCGPARTPPTPVEIAPMPPRPPAPPASVTTPPPSVGTPLPSASGPLPSVSGPVLGPDGACTGPAPAAAAAIEPGIGECELVRLKGRPPTDVLVGEGRAGREVQVLYAEPGAKELYFFVNNRLDRIVKS